MNNKVGQVINLFISNDTQKNIAQDMVMLDCKGIIGDKFYDKNIDRSVFIVSDDSYNLSNENGIILNYGMLGENILLDYNPYHLQIGDRIKIGEDVVLEISSFSTLCKGLSKINNKLPKLLKKDRGIFAKVIVDGTITLNDKVYI
jgi:MOSC domain-containing protein YiiM